MEVLAPRQLIARIGEAAGGRQRLDRLCQQAGGVRSPLELVTVLAPLGKGLWKDRIGKHRLIAATRRTEPTWQLVLVDLVERSSGDTAARGVYRQILDGSRDAASYLDRIDQGIAELQRLTPRHPEPDTANRAALDDPMWPWVDVTPHTPPAPAVFLARSDWTRGLAPRGQDRGELAAALLQRIMAQPNLPGTHATATCDGAHLEYLELPRTAFNAEQAVLLLDTHPLGLEARPRPFRDAVAALQRRVQRSDDHGTDSEGALGTLHGTWLRGLADRIYTVDASHPPEAIEAQAAVFDPELFFELDNEQQRLLHDELHTKPPLFITGRAGSSKSTLLHHVYAGYCMHAVRDAPAGEPRFITRSSALLAEAEGRVRTLLLGHHHLSDGDEHTIAWARHRMTTLTRHFREQLGLTGETELFPDGSHMNFERFRRLYEARTPAHAGSESERVLRDHRVKQQVTAATAWFVIRALIKGYDPSRHAHSPEDGFGPEDYRELPESDRPVSDFQFDLVFDSVYAKWYAPLLAGQRLWDDQDLALRVLATGRSSGSTPRDVAAIVCDEAQDLTRLEVLALCRTSQLLHCDLTKVADRALPLVLAGDEEQTLHPTGFRWANVTAGFHQLTNAAFSRARTIADKELSLNYRSRPEVVGLANALQRIRHDLLGETSAKPQEPRLPPSGRPPQAIDLDPDEPPVSLATVLVANAVLVPCDEDQEEEYVRGDTLLAGALHGHSHASRPGAAPVYGPHAFKGREFRSVILYRWGEWIRGVHADVEPIEGRNRYARLYTAITRAKDRLVIVECGNDGLAFWRDLSSYVAAGPNPGHAAIEFASEDALAELEQDAERFAEETAERGRRLDSVAELQRAVRLFVVLGLDDNARRCEADVLRLEQDYSAAAAIYRDLGDTDRMIDCLWHAQAFPDLAGTEGGDEVSALRRHIARELGTAAANPDDGWPGVAAALVDLAYAGGERGVDPSFDDVLILALDALESVLAGDGSWSWQAALNPFADDALLSRVVRLAHDTPLIAALRWLHRLSSGHETFVAQRLIESYPHAAARQELLAWLGAQAWDRDTKAAQRLLAAVSQTTPTDAPAVELSLLARADPCGPRAAQLVAGSLHRLTSSLASLTRQVAGERVHD